MSRTDEYGEWKNQNVFAKDDRFLGGKLGYTDEARQTALGLFALKTANGVERKVAVVILHSADWKSDTRRSLSWFDAAVAYGESPNAFPLDGESFAKAKRALESVSLTFTGEMVFGPTLRNFVAFHAGGDFKKIFAKAPTGSRETFLVGALRGDLHPLAAAALGEFGFDVLRLESVGEKTRERLALESILPARGTPALFRDPFSGLEVKFVPASGRERAAGLAAVDVERKKTPLVIALLDEAGDEEDNFARALVDAGAAVVARPGRPEVGEETIIRYRESVILNLGSFVGEPGERGAVVSLRLSGDGRLLGVKDQVLTVNKFYEPVALAR